MTEALQTKEALASSAHDHTVRAYRFLQEHSLSQEPFTLAEVSAAAGWEGQTAKTYRSKHWKDILVHVGKGQYRVKPDFQRIPLERFLVLSTQIKNLFSRYERHRYEQAVSYEFLLPLKREDELRRALDELFFLDTVRRRLIEIGVARFQEWSRALAEESEEEYISRIARTIGDRFGGYSISHVSGRFRSQELMTREGAAKLLTENHQYLIDETTASVRFLIPLDASKTVYFDTFPQIDAMKVTPNLLVLDEVKFVHEVFFQLFAEAAVRTVAGEDEIWLVEDSPVGRYLYVWRRAELT